MNDLLSRVKRNQLALIKARDFPLSDDEEAFLEDEEVGFDFDAEYQKDDKTIFVVYLIDEMSEREENAGSKIFSEKISQFRDMTENDTIILIASGFTSDAEKRFEEARKISKAYYEAWTFRSLLVNPLEHFLVPPHRILTKEEIAREIPLLANPATQREFLSKMNGLSNDPVAKWIGARVGDIVRIDRTSRMLGGATIPAYRVVRRVSFF